MTLEEFKAVEEKAVLVGGAECTEDVEDYLDASRKMVPKLISVAKHLRLCVLSWNAGLPVEPGSLIAITAKNALVKLEQP